jgi:CHAT domain-containing protein
MPFSLMPLLLVGFSVAPQDPGNRVSSGGELDLTEPLALHCAWKGQATRLQAAGARVLSKERTPEQLELMDGVRVASKSLSRLVHLKATDRPEDYAEQVAALREERQATERALNRSLGLDEIMATPTAKALVAAIPKGGALVDYAVGEHVFAWVVHPESTIQLTYLGETADIEPLSEAFLDDLIARRGAEALPSGDERDLNAELYALVWEPIADLVKGRGTLLLCPDGFLGKLPFAVLQDRGRQYLLEHHHFVYLEDPTAHVARREKSGETSDSFLAMGDVEYGDAFSIGEAEKEKWMALSRDENLRAAIGKTWTRLAATEAETQVITGMHMEGLGREVRRKILSGTDPSEARLKKELPNYGFLHLATHGFFEPAEEESQLPGLSAGLVCANANLPKKEGEDDGFLTAEEVAHLDLQNCQMVVLSACETALGTVRAGEGLQSLRRAFIIAGADTVVSSLWKVRDTDTSTLMMAFYRNLWIESQGRGPALRNAQLEMLRHYRDSGTDGRPSSWGAFVLAGAWR